MAVGDDAKSAGYALVPDTGEDGKVKWGAREINRTRDFVAQVKGSMPNGKAGYRSASGITVGTADPVNTAGDDGDIYLKVL
jgi:hypothetical protein